MKSNRMHCSWIAILSGVCINLVFSFSHAKAFSEQPEIYRESDSLLMSSALESLAIPANGVAVQTNTVLVVNQVYSIAVAGVYRYDVGEPGEFADAHYREDDNDQWSISYPAVEFNGTRLTANIKDLPAHTHTYSVTGNGSPLSLRIYDDGYGDNEGYLTAYLYEGGSAPDPYVDAVVDSQGNGAANTNNTTPGNVVGVPSCLDYFSLGGGEGYLVLDMGIGEEIENSPGMDFRVYEVEESCSAPGTAEPYEVFVGDTPDGPWTSIGFGSGISEFALPENILSARYVKIIDHAVIPEGSTWSAPGADIYGAEVISSAYQPTLTPTPELYTRTPTSTNTPTRTKTSTKTKTTTKTKTSTKTKTQTRTYTATNTVIATYTPTVTLTETPTVTPTETPTVTPTYTETNPHTPQGYGIGTCWMTIGSWSTYFVDYSFEPNFPENWIESIHNAAAIWNNVTPSNLTFYYLENSVNKIGVGPLPGNEAASTVITLNNDGEIINTITTFNWNAPLSIEIPVPADTYNVESVMLHEFGHWLSALDVDDPICADQVMYYIGSPGVLRLVLGIHDIEAINFQYPS